MVCERNASEGAEGPRCAVCVYDITWCTAESSSSVYTSVLLAVAVAARPLETVCLGESLRLASLAHHHCWPSGPTGRVHLPPCVYCTFFRSSAHRPRRGVRLRHQRVRVQHLRLRVGKLRREDDVHRLVQVQPRLCCPVCVPPHVSSLSEWSCVATPAAVPKHGRAVSRSSQLRALARPLTRTSPGEEVESGVLRVPHPQCS